MTDTGREGKVLASGKKITSNSCTLPSIWRGLQLQRAQSALDPNQSPESHELLVQAQLPHKQQIEKAFDKYVETFPISPYQTLDFDPNDPESFDFITNDQLTPPLDSDTLVREMDKILGKSAPWHNENLDAKVITEEMASQANYKYIEHAHLILNKDLSIEVMDSKSTILQQPAIEPNEMDLTKAPILLSFDKD